jgi:hypothetical protein
VGAAVFAASGRTGREADVGVVASRARYRLSHFRSNLDWPQTHIADWFTIADVPAADVVTFLRVFADAIGMFETAPLRRISIT